MPITKAALLKKLAVAMSDADIAKVKSKMKNFSSFDYDTVKCAYRNAFKKDVTLEQVAVIADRITETSNWIVVHGGDRFRDQDIPYESAALACKALVKIFKKNYGAVVENYTFEYFIGSNAINLNADNVDVVFKFKYADGIPSPAHARSEAFTLHLQEELRTKLVTYHVHFRDQNTMTLILTYKN